MPFALFIWKDVLPEPQRKHRNPKVPSSFWTELMPNPWTLPLVVLSGDALELVPSLGRIDARGLEHVHVVVQGEAVAAEGEAVEPSVELAGIEGALEVLLEVGPAGELVGDVGEDAHRGIGRVVGIVDDHDVGQIRRRRADGELLLEIRERDVLRDDLDLLWDELKSAQTLAKVSC